MCFRFKLYLLIAFVCTDILKVVRYKGSVSLQSLLQEIWLLSMGVTGGGFIVFVILRKRLPSIFYHDFLSSFNVSIFFRYECSFLPFVDYTYSDVEKDFGYV